MADSSEEKSSVNNDIYSTKAAIFDSLNSLKKYRENWAAEWRMKQQLESEKLLQLSKNNQKLFGQILENGAKHQHSDLEDMPKEDVPEMADLSSISIPISLSNLDSPQESITGHLQRCLDDSSQSNMSISGNKVQHAPEKIPVFSELRNVQFSEKNLQEDDNSLAETGAIKDTAQPKRPFLKKGSGLQRYMPKSNDSCQFNAKESPKQFSITTDHLPKKTLNLKPAFRNTDVPSEKGKHIRFQDLNDSVEAQTNDFPSASKANEKTADADIPDISTSKHSIPSASTSSENNKSEISSPESENLNLSSDSKELEQFELLENCAQNSSFNSDSSVVQKIFQGELAKPSCVNENSTRLPSQNTTSTKNEVYINPSEKTSYPTKFNLNLLDRNEVQARKQRLQEAISDKNLKIQSSQNELSHEQNLDDSNDRCSTPVNLEERYYNPECHSNFGSLVSEISPEIKTSHFIGDANETSCLPDCACCNVENDCKNFYTVQDHELVCCDKEECACNYSNGTDEGDLDLNEKAKYRAMLVELQKEVKTYQQLNAKLSSIDKERKDIIRKLQKEREDFKKFKECENQKLEEERRQMKRERESFNRYKKLSKNDPSAPLTKKERDELNSLRIENGKLLEDLKRKDIKYNKDTRNFKLRVENAERERDKCKLEMIAIEEQRDDLLTTVKAHRMKNVKSLDDQDTVNKANVEHNVEKKDAETQTQDLDLNLFQESNKPCLDSTEIKKSKTPFTLSSELQKKNVDVVDKVLDDPSKNENIHCEQDGLISKSDNEKNNGEKPTTNDNLSVISVSTESEIKEINNGNSIERIYPTGEKEIVYNSGTRKMISADGKSRKFYFYNGDIKEIFSDGKEIYSYVNGVVETSLPDGTKISEFPNGQIQHRHPDGQKEVRFPDGTVQNISADGSEEIHAADGSVIQKCSNGTRIIALANGQKEIVTSTYKRREYPDGSIKIVYNCGKQETRYSSGRIKLKDKEGKTLLDTKYLSTSKG